MSLYDEENPLLVRPRPFWEEEEPIVPVVQPVAAPAAPPPEVEGPGYASLEDIPVAEAAPPPEVVGPGYASPEEIPSVKEPPPPEVEGPGYASLEEIPGARQEEPPKPPSAEAKPKDLERPEFIPGYRPEPGKVDKAREFLKETKQGGVQSDVQDTINSILVGGSDKGLLAAMGGIYRLVEAKTRDMPWLSTIHENSKHEADEVQKMRETVRAGLPVDKEFEKSLTGQFTSGAGQVLGTLPLAAAPGPLGAVVTTAVSIGQLYDEGYQDYVDTRKRLGLPIDEKVADEVASKYVTGAAPIDILAERFMLGKALKNQVGRRLGDVVKDIAKTVTSGGLSEGGQQLWLNAIAKIKDTFGVGYDPNRALTEDVAASTVVGGGLGGGVTTAGAVISSALPEQAAVVPAAAPPPLPPPPIPSTPVEAFAPPPGVQPGVTITPAPGEVPPPPGLIAAPPEAAPPPIPGTVPPPLPGAVEPGEFPQKGYTAIEPAAPSVEIGPRTPEGDAVTQVVGKQNAGVTQVASEKAETLQAANAPKTADAIQQVARASNVEASVSAAEYLQQAKQQQAEAAAEAQAEAAKAAEAAAPAEAVPAAVPAERPYGQPPPLPPTAIAPAAVPPVAAPAQGVSIPVMITRQMEADLLARGVPQEQINRMTPAQAYEALQPAPPAAPVAAPQPAPAPSAHAVVVGGQVFTGPTQEDAVRAAYGAVGGDAMDSAETGWVDSESGRFVSHDIYNAHLALNTAMEQTGNDEGHPAVQQATAQFAEAQARDVEINSQIVQPGGEQVVQTGVKGQEALVAVRPSQELAMPLAGVNATVSWTDTQGQTATVQRPAAQALNDARNDKTALTILLNCLT